MEYTSLSDYCKDTFGVKLYKLSLDSGCTCPNRDGLLDTRGCLFCSAGGSGDFAASARGVQTEAALLRQLEEAKSRVRRKFPEGDSEEGRYIAYVQSFTGTYPGKDGFVKDSDGVSSFDRMRERYLALIRRPEVRVLSIATRPDCLGEEVLDLLKELRAIKPVWVELGLQTSNEETAAYIRRYYRNEVYEQAVRDLSALDIPVVTHVILGLPGETLEDMKATVRYAVGCGTWGIKLQLLPVRCTEIGTAGNGLVPGQLGTLVDLIGYVANVQNTTATSGGTDIESDDDLRLRVYYAAASYSVAGPEDAYNYFVRSFSSDISDVRVTNPAPVEVAIYVVLNDATLPGSEFLQRLEEYLQDGQIRPLSDRVSVLAPTAKNYTFDITYYVNQSDKASAASIQADVEKAVSNYVKWQGSVIGRDINPDKLRNFVLSAGAKRCEITGMTFTQTAETEIPVLSAHTVTYGGLEDD